MNWNSAYPFDKSWIELKSEVYVITDRRSVLKAPIPVHTLKF